MRNKILLTSISVNTCAIMASMTTLLPLVDADAACCSPDAAGLDQAEALEAAAVFKALGDPTRLRLLSIIATRPEGEACVCDLTDPVGLSQPTVSHHMAQLARAGLVTREQRGRWAYFAVAPGARRLVQGALSAVLGAEAATSGR